MKPIVWCSAAKPVEKRGVSKNSAMPWSGQSFTGLTYGQVGQPRLSISANMCGSMVSLKKAPSAPPSLSAWVWIRVMVYG